jgi:hypothetical protein
MILSIVGHSGLTWGTEAFEAIASVDLGIVGVLHFALRILRPLLHILVQVAHATLEGEELDVLSVLILVRVVERKGVLVHVL